MRLQSTQPPRQRGSSTNNKSNRKLLLIIVTVIIVVVVLIIFSVVRDMSALKPDDKSVSSSTPDDGQQVDSAPPVIQTEPVIVDDTEPGLVYIPINDESIFHKNEDAFTFDVDMQFSEATALASSNSISVGTELSISPIRSCVYHFDGNRIDISHTSGASLGIMRGYFKGDLDVSLIDAELQENIASGGAKDIRLMNVYLGGAVCGRYGTGEVDVDGETYKVLLAYIKRDNELYSIVGLVEPDAEDFLSLMLSNVYVSSRPLIFE